MDILAYWNKILAVRGMISENTLFCCFATFYVLLSTSFVAWRFYQVNCSKHTKADRIALEKLAEEVPSDSKSKTRLDRIFNYSISIDLFNWISITVIFFLLIIFCGLQF